MYVTMLVQLYRVKVHLLQLRRGQGSLPYLRTVQSPGTSQKNWTLGVKRVWSGYKLPRVSVPLFVHYSEPGFSLLYHSCAVMLVLTYVGRTLHHRGQSLRLRGSGWSENTHLALLLRYERQWRKSRWPEATKDRKSESRTANKLDSWTQSKYMWERLFVKSNRMQKIMYADTEDWTLRWIILKH